MRGTNEQDAQVKQQQWVLQGKKPLHGTRNLSDDALASFGQALHTLTDMESPTHKGFQVWKGLYPPGEALDHIHGEESPSPESVSAAIEAAQAAFKGTFGDAAADEATTNPKNPNNPNAYYDERYTDPDHTTIWDKKKN